MAGQDNRIPPPATPTPHRCNDRVEDLVQARSASAIAPGPLQACTKLTLLHAGAVHLGARDQDPACLEAVPQLPQGPARVRPDTARKPGLTLCCTLTTQLGRTREEPRDPYLVITDGEVFLRPGVRKRPGQR